AFASGAKPAGPSFSPARVAAVAAGGLGATILVKADVHKWLWDELREATQPNLAKEREAAALEYERQRQAEVERLRSEASIWRLLQLVLLMLPVAIYWPVWIFDSALFWHWVSARIDGCGPCFI
ncbi:unnamed protein product, partial [Effrenium voratum]